MSAEGIESVLERKFNNMQGTDGTQGSRRIRKDGPPARCYGLAFVTARIPVLNKRAITPYIKQLIATAVIVVTMPWTVLRHPTVSIP